MSMISGASKGSSGGGDIAPPEGPGRIFDYAVGTQYMRGTFRWVALGTLHTNVFDLPTINSTLRYTAFGGSFQLPDGIGYGVEHITGRLVYVHQPTLTLNYPIEVFGGGYMNGRVNTIEGETEPQSNIDAAIWRLGNTKHAFRSNGYWVLDIQYTTPYQSVARRFYQRDLKHGHNAQGPAYNEYIGGYNLYDPLGISGYINAGTGTGGDTITDAKGMLSAFVAFLYTE
jgi:hypothetical protein